MTPALIERLKEASERFDGKRIFEIRQGCSVEHAADLVALKAVAQEAAAELSRLRQSEASILQMCLCETGIFLKPDQLYRFVVCHQCARCQELAALGETKK